MMKCSEYAAAVKNGDIDKKLCALYGADAVKGQRKRYEHMLDEFETYFGNTEVRLFSSPGRTELCGNHTDHNGGKVIAGALSVDIAAAAEKSDKITIISDGYGKITAEVTDAEPDKTEYGTVKSIIKGVLHFFKKKNYNIGGFNAYITSQVPKGSGMSSSAAFEVLICTVLNRLYNGSAIDFKETAQISQKAENIYFGKPCGLMDQMACAAGGIVYVDFFNEKDPTVKKVECRNLSEKYAVCIVDTGANHADLTDDYALVPREMRLIAKSLGVSRLADTDREKLYKKLPELIKDGNHRAILRAMHFFDENDRVDAIYKYFEDDKTAKALELMGSSGHSSFEYLQNVYSPHAATEQRIPIALKLAWDFINNVCGDGACRVHGGGFAGTTLNIIPKEYAERFCKYINGFFGNESCHILKIRQAGGVCIE